MAKLISRNTSPWRRAICAIFPTAALLFCLLTLGPAPEAKGAGLPGAVKILADAAYYDTLTTLISNADQRIDLAMFLFKTTISGANRPAALVRDLIAAEKRGVKVRVILEYSGHDQAINQANQETAAALRKGGVTVFFDSPGRTSHAKLAVIDGRYCLVGSHNLTQSALKYNHEFSLLLDNPALAREIMAYLEKLIM